MGYDSALPKLCLAALLLATAGCQQATADDAPDAASEKRPASGAIERIDLDAPAQPTITAANVLPDATGAQWQLTANGKTLRFANPAGQPLLALTCAVPPKGEPLIQFTHYANAPAGAKALFAMVGNMRVARVNMDAHEQGKRSIWRGSEPAEAQKLEALMGTNEVVATMPGGGEIKLKGSSLPRDFIKACRSKAKPKATPTLTVTNSPAGPA